ncbi:hypothetical protein D3C78_1634400 [compost metagenome]
MRGFGQLLQRQAAVLAGLARRNADFQDLLVGKQRQRAARREHRTPVEVRASDGVAAALGIARGARRGPDGVGRLLLLQRLIAVQGIERAQALAQMGIELVQNKLHGRVTAS